MQFQFGDILVGLEPKKRTDKELQKGLSWLHAAADQGQAQNKLGTIYLYEPRSQDTATAFYRLSQSAKQANPSA